MTEQLIQPKSLGSYVRCLSGLFISKENPSGLSPKECTILAALCFILKDNKREINKEVKVELANLTNHNVQVITNYINKFKKKRAITKNNTLHPIFFKRLIIEYGANNM